MLDRSTLVKTATMRAELRSIAAEQLDRPATLARTATAMVMGKRSAEENDDKVFSKTAFAHLDWIDSFKGFVLFFAFNCLYMFLSTMRIDWMHASTTLDHYDRVRTTINVTKFDQRVDIHSQVRFLDRDFDQMTTEL